MAMADRGLSAAFQEGFRGGRAKLEAETQREWRSEEAEKDREIQRKAGEMAERQVVVQEEASARAQEVADRTKKEYETKKTIAAEYGDDPIIHSQKLQEAGMTEDAVKVLNLAKGNLELESAQMSETYKSVATGLELVNAGDITGGMESMNRFSKPGEKVTKIERTSDPDKFKVYTEDDPEGKVQSLSQYRDMMVSADTRYKADIDLRKAAIAAEAKKNLKPGQLWSPVLGMGIKESDLRERYKLHLEKEFGLVTDYEDKYKSQLISPEMYEKQRLLWTSLGDKIPSLGEFSYSKFDVNIGEAPPVAGAKLGKDPVTGQAGWYVRKGNKTYKVKK